MSTNPLVLRWEGCLGYAALLGVLGILLHWGIGPSSVELGALVFVLGLIVPSLAVKQVVVPPPLPSGDVGLLASAEVRDPKETK